MSWFLSSRNYQRHLFDFTGFFCIAQLFWHLLFHMFSFGILPRQCFAHQRDPDRHRVVCSLFSHQEFQSRTLACIQLVTRFDPKPTNWRLRFLQFNELPGFSPIIFQIFLASICDNIHCQSFRHWSDTESRLCSIRSSLPCWRALSRRPDRQDGWAWYLLCLASIDCCAYLFSFMCGPRLYLRSHRKPMWFSLQLGSKAETCQTESHQETQEDDCKAFGGYCRFDLVEPRGWKLDGANHQKTRRSNHRYEII